jgi:hypothetical protein
MGIREDGMYLWRGQLSADCVDHDATTFGKITLSAIVRSQVDRG